MSADKGRNKKTRGRRAKLTLSVEPKYVAMLRKAGARSGRSISELVTELAIRLEGEGGGSNKGAEWLERNLGVMADKIHPKLIKGDDRLGYLLRKHAK